MIRRTVFVHTCIFVPEYTRDKDAILRLHPEYIAKIGNEKLKKA